MGEPESLDINHMIGSTHTTAMMSRTIISLGEPPPIGSLPELLGRNDGGLLPLPEPPVLLEELLDVRSLFRLGVSARLRDPLEPESVFLLLVARTFRFPSLPEPLP